jgi:hypothetical protein
MLMLYNKIMFEIDINNDELLKILWEHRKKMKRERKIWGGRILLN